MAQGDLYNLTAFEMCAHNGTHIDAPRHFIKEGNAVDEIDLQHFVGMAYVVEWSGTLSDSDAAQILENAKKQDLEVVTNPTMGFTIESADLPDLANIKTVVEASENFAARIDACKTVEELQETLKYCNAEIQGGIYKAAISQKAMYSTMEGDSNFSAYALYTKWAMAMGYIS